MNRAILAGIFLLSFIAQTIVISALLLFLGPSPSGWMAIGGLITSAATTFFLAKTSRMDNPTAATATAVGLGVAIIAASCFISNFMLDVSSYDGFHYHMAAIAALSDGWNPIYEPMSVSSLFSLAYSPDTEILWCETYPQGVWEFAACLYDLTGFIEVSKCYTLLSALGAALLLAGYLRRHGLKIWQITLISIILVANPITLVQFDTFLIDGFIMMMLAYLIIGLIMLADLHSGLRRRVSLIIIFESFMCLCTTKLTALTFACAFGVAFLILYGWQTFRKHERSKTELLKLCGIFVFTLLFSFFIVGFSPYVTNQMEYGNFFYPLFGEGSIDIVTPNEPVIYTASDIPIINFLRSLFSYSSTGELPDGVLNVPTPLKLPFVVYSPELAQLVKPNLVTAGFGPLNSGIFVLSIPVFVICLAVSYDRYTLLFQSLVAFTAPAIGMLFFFEAAWWMRYVAYLYFFNPFTLVFLFLVLNDRFSRRIKALASGFAGLIAILLSINAGFFVKGHVLPDFDSSCVIYQKINEVKQAQEMGKYVTFSKLSNRVESYPFTDYLGGGTLTFIDNGVKIDEIPPVQEGVDYTTYTEANGVIYHIEE